eukprot:5415694-Amphidinium_carterae.1
MSWIVVCVLTSVWARSSAEWSLDPMVCCSTPWQTLNWTDSARNEHSMPDQCTLHGRVALCVQVRIGP